MAKNTRSYAFRSVDVDLYNEDAYKEEEEAEKKKVLLSSPPLWT